MEKKLENYFKRFRKHIIGQEAFMEGPFGRKRIIYADWTASGRLYEPIEKRISEQIGVNVANTHTETTHTGSLMTHAYHHAKELIKKHVNASADDVIITEGSGMTGVVSKFQRILGLRIPEHFKDQISIEEEDRPVVFVSHMEHHSNQTSWIETIAEVVIIPADADGLIDVSALKKLLEKYKSRRLKIASITAASNVTGIITPYYEIAEIMHSNGGLCFVDFACSGPYVEIDMHKSKSQYLDAIFFSPHKFLGGPGGSGVLIFDKNLYRNTVPDNPGGGTVTFTNPWGGHGYFDDIETREDGGTPAFLQTIKVALAIKLKEEMGVGNILAREHDQVSYVFDRLKKIQNIEILAENHENRLGIFSFYIPDVNYNLVVKILNDRFGIQTRGGCSCAGTYGHYLLHLDEHRSGEIAELIEQGCLLDRPGWIRMSIHPTMSDDELKFICNSIQEIASNIDRWKEDYIHDIEKNEFLHKDYQETIALQALDWFNL